MASALHEMGHLFAYLGILLFILVLINLLLIRALRAEQYKNKRNPFSKNQR